MYIYLWYIVYRSVGHLENTDVHFILIHTGLRWAPSLILRTLHLLFHFAHSSPTPALDMSFFTTASIEMNTTEETDFVDMKLQNPIPAGIRLIYYIIGVVGILDNGIVLVVMLSSRQLRRRSANIIIVNQSLIDGLASFFLIGIAVPYVGIPDQMTCKLWLNRFPLWCLLVSSTYNILCLALDRYLAIKHPLWHKSFILKRKAKLLLLFPWLFGIGFESAFAIPTSVVIGDTCLGFASWPSKSIEVACGMIILSAAYIVPIILQVYLYGRVFFVIYHRGKSGLSTSGTDDETTVTQHSSPWWKAQRNALKIAVMVSICFVGCWTFDQISFMMYLINGAKAYDVTFFSYTLTLVVANSCINPFIYALQYDAFRCALRKLICKKDDQEPKSSSSATSNETTTSQSTA